MLANLLRSRPDIAAITHSRADALLETLDAAERLASLLPRLGCLVRRIEDSRSKWLAEALPPTLATCKRALAGVQAESDRHGGMHRRPPPTRRNPSFRKREGRR